MICCRHVDDLRRKPDRIGEQKDCDGVPAPQFHGSPRLVSPGSPRMVSPVHCTLRVAACSSGVFQ